jgi:Tautomerase enzyme
MPSGWYPLASAASNPARPGATARRRTPIPRARPRAPARWPRAPPPPTSCVPSARATVTSTPRRAWSGSPRRVATRPDAPRLRASRPDRRVLGEPKDADVRRALARLRGGSGAQGGAGRHAARGRPVDTGREEIVEIPPGAGERYTLIEITAFPGRSTDAKRRFYQAIVRNLTAERVPAQDVLVVLTEPPMENWGIRGGKPASEVDLGFRVDV